LAVAGFIAIAGCSATAPHVSSSPSVSAINASAASTALDSAAQAAQNAGGSYSNGQMIVDQCPLGDVLALAPASVWPKTQSPDDGPTFDFSNAAGSTGVVASCHYRNRVPEVVFRASDTGGELAYNHFQGASTTTESWSGGTIATASTYDHRYAAVWTTSAGTFAFSVEINGPNLSLQDAESLLKKALPVALAHLSSAR
jgi:hypothetical protein